MALFRQGADDHHGWATSLICPHRSWVHSRPCPCRPRSCCPYRNAGRSRFRWKVWLSHSVRVRRDVEGAGMPVTRWPRTAATADRRVGTPPDGWRRLLSLDELRRRMPELRQREHALQTELNSILDQISDRAVFLRLAENLSGFLTRLRSSADTLDIQERQRIVRLVVRDILVGDETIVIRHSIPLSSMTPSGDGGVQSKSAAPPAPGGRSYLLRSGSNDTG